MANPNGRHGRAKSEPRHTRIGRIGRIACSWCRLLTVICSSALAAFATAASSASQDIEELIVEALRVSSDGDFETAWANHLRAWKTAATFPDAGDAMLAYCERHNCPNIRKTGWLLGKPDSELAFLAESCRGSESNACQRWFNGLHRLRAHLGPDRACHGSDRRRCRCGSSTSRPGTSRHGRSLRWPANRSGHFWTPGRRTPSSAATWRTFGGWTTPWSATPTRSAYGTARHRVSASWFCVKSNWVRQPRSAHSPLPLMIVRPTSSTPPTVLVPAPDGTTIPVLIDTAARDNH